MSTTQKLTHMHIHRISPRASRQSLPRLTCINLAHNNKNIPPEPHQQQQQDQQSATEHQQQPMDQVLDTGVTDNKSATKSANPLKKMNQRQIPYMIKPGTLVASLFTYKQCHNAHLTFNMRTILTKLIYMVRDRCYILATLANYLNSDLLKYIYMLEEEL